MICWGDEKRTGTGIIGHSSRGKRKEHMEKIQNVGKL